MKRVNLEIYDNNKTYFYPSMEIATPERVAMDYAVVNVPDVTLVIESDQSGSMLYTAPSPIQVMAQRLGVDYTQYDNDEDVLVAMEEILNAPQPEPEPSAEERIASAMEYQNLLM